MRIQLSKTAALTAILASCLLAPAGEASANVTVPIFARFQQIADPFLEEIGVDFNLGDFSVDLPPRAAQEVNSALDRAASALSGVLGGVGGGILSDINLPNIDLPNLDIPQVNVPDVDQIVSDALNGVNVPNVDSILDDVLGGIDLNIPSVSIPQIDIPQINVPDVNQIVNDAIGGATGAVNDALNDLDGVLGDLDGSLGSVLDGVLGDGQSIGGVIDDVLDGIDTGSVGSTVDGILDDLLGDAEGVLDRVLGDLNDIDPVNEVLNNLPFDQLPAVVLDTVESVFGRLNGQTIEPQFAAAQASFMTQPLVAASAVPEPGSFLMVIATTALGLGRRRR